MERTYKKIEVVGASEKSFAEAVKNARQQRARGIVDQHDVRPAGHHPHRAGRRSPA